MTWHGNVNRWLLRAAKSTAVLLIGMLFACPFLARPWLVRLSSHAVAWNASILMTLGAFLLVRGRLRVAADWIYLTLTLIGAWGSTISIFLLENVRYSTGLGSVLAITAEQSPFLAVLGAMFFFANFRSSDVLIKHSLRVVAAVSIGVWIWFLLSETLPLLARRIGAFPKVALDGLAGGLIAALLLLFYVVAQRIERIVDCWILRQPDFRATLRLLWERMVRIDAEADLFVSVEDIVCHALDVSAAHVLPRNEIPAIEHMPERTPGAHGTWLAAIPAVACCRAWMWTCCFPSGCMARSLT